MTDQTVEEIKRRKLAALQRQSSEARPAEPIDLDDAAQFSRLLEDHPVVLVDCYADWCGPCQQLKPIVSQVGAETTATVVMVDIDIHQSLVSNWNVRSVPTLLLFVDGTLTERLVGVQPFSQLTQLIERYDVS